MMCAGYGILRWLESHTINYGTKLPLVFVVGPFWAYLEDPNYKRGHNQKSELLWRLQACTLDSCCKGMLTFRASNLEFLLCSRPVGRSQRLQGSGVRVGYRTV